MRFWCLGCGSLFCVCNSILGFWVCVVCLRVIWILILRYFASSLLGLVYLCSFQDFMCR